MTVTFCGHRQIYDRDEVEPWLSQTIQKLIDEGADCFYLGNYGAFDHMAAHALQTFKKDHPHIHIALVLPYRGRQYDAYLYDEIIYPLFDNKPRRYNILLCNRWMVRHSDAIVAYVLYGWGGAAKTLDDALAKGKRVIDYSIDP